ncbi:1-phosphofructokinase [Agrilactobacillus composti DSM 18527 = JCM 14202]|uniref:Tagatose-6-phosphate kinase n=1 Tax=Agrilactobacillus composti DSM 18527 = JCM 14202 TaxID=1423734 RepID=X0PNF7_9LACO|nr:1-phosphofructokinase [Agrilactobacillus composti]KRM36582.1 1-phosphofructokinase [Agrilactobacillus composti DSM 18527 = JCM 14202]GAF39097.1 1-phosphofructokinase [Agrilactobacillus composti DSM 18527 = JCM 14202]
MIYTVTANPAIDYVVTADTIQLGTVNRLNSSVSLPGGKGINVSRILKQLTIETTALGFIGGYTGAFVKSTLAAEDLTTNFTEISDTTRINVKIKADQETEINGQGPKVTPKEISKFEDTLGQLKPGDVVVMSGSLPPSLPDTFYKDLIPLIREQGADFVIDTTGQALLDTLSYHPLVVKPNHHELAELFHVQLTSLADIAKYGRQLLDLGAKNVLISMAGDGAFLITPTKTYYSKAPKGTVVNSVGAGDSMIAGFTGIFAQNNDPVASFKMGLSCGSATAFTKDLADRSQIEALSTQIKIEAFQ